MTVTLRKTFDTLNGVANRVSGDIGKKSIALQLVLCLLLVLRVLYAAWAFLHLSLTSLMWSLIVISVLLLGITAARSRQRFLLLIYIAAAVVLMILTAVGIFLALVGDILTLSLDVLAITLDAITLLLQLITVALAYNLYVYLDPQHNIAIEELNGASDQVHYPHLDDNVMNIDLEQEAAMAQKTSGFTGEIMEQPSPYAWALPTQPPVYQDAVYAPYVYATAPALTQAETAPRSEPNPFHEPK